MGNILADSFDTYMENLKLIILFSIAFVIAFAIPMFAPLPTFISAGAIFLRNASIFVNGNISGFSLVVITLSTFFSILFLSFAFVAISLIVKSRKTHLKTSSKAFADIERHVGKVFVMFVAATFLLLFVNMMGYLSGGSSFLTPLLAFLIFALIFYAPAAVVIDNKNITRAVKESIKLNLSVPRYFALWLVLVFFVLSFFDAAVIAVAGTLWSRYIMLVVNSLFILPYFVIFTVEAYIRRFKILSH